MRTRIGTPEAAALLALLSWLAAPASWAGLIPPFGPRSDFKLGNHPDGGLAPPYYGLRLDGLDGDIAHEFAFDFGFCAPDAAALGCTTIVPSGQASIVEMTLSIDTDRSVTISGSVYGGRVEAGSFVSPQLWDLFFRYDDYAILNAGNANPNDDVLAIPAAVDGAGEIHPRARPAEVRELVEEAGGHPNSFTLERGQRGYPSLSGEGWLNHDAHPTHVYSTDWLFTALELQEIPEPRSLVLLGGGLLGLSLAGRRRA